MQHITGQQVAHIDDAHWGLDNEGPGYHDALLDALDCWRDELRLDLSRTHGTPEHEIHKVTAERLLEVARIIGIANGESTI